MHFQKSFFFIAACIFSFTTYSQEIDYKGFPQWSWAKRDSTEYYIYTPSNMKPGEKYPVVLFMHGCCGADPHATLRNAVDPPARMWHNFGANTQRVPTYIISPKTTRGWQQHFENLKAVMDELIASSQGDPQRIYVIGFSMGGDGTWKIIEKYPGYFAAAMPMGMDFKGKDPEKFKDIPIWTNRGETDWFARHLGTQMGEIRKLNGYKIDSSNWVTGVNPRITTFKKLGHVVMWPAVSTQDLAGWAYSKINDGNKYPVVFFTSPAYNQEVNKNEEVPVQIEAKDADGSIVNVEIFVNGKLIRSINHSPYAIKIKVPNGNSTIEAKAIDDKGKSTTAATIVRVNLPVEINSKKLSAAQQGSLYNKTIHAAGNGEIIFSSNTNLPEGLELTNDGRIKGIPVKTGNYSIGITATDEDGDKAEKQFSIKVRPKKKSEVIVSNPKNYARKLFPISKIALGELPHNDRGDDEVTFSAGLDKYMGLTFIQTDFNDTVDAKPFYMEFETDEDVTVYVAYEKLDRLFSSTIPDWLKDFHKEDGEQIVTQYFYYDMYSKDFPKGKIQLHDAEEKKNGVNTNYFIMVKKK